MLLQFGESFVADLSLISPAPCWSVRRTLSASETGSAMVCVVGRKDDKCSDGRAQQLGEGAVTAQWGQRPEVMPIDAGRIRQKRQPSGLVIARCRSS